MSELFEIELDSLGINPKQYGALLVIYNHPNISQKEVGNKLQIDRTTIGQQIDILEQKGLVIKVAHQSDRRIYCMKLTEYGEEVIKSLWEKMKQCEDQVLSTLAKDKKIEFYNTIKRIYEE